MNRSDLRAVLFGCILIVLMLIGKTTRAQDTTSVRIMLESYGVKHVDIVLAQSRLETGNYKCNNCSLDNNNLFGFFYKGKYLKFDTWIDSIKYYKWWQSKLYKGGDYYEFLKRVGYAEDKNYIKKLKTIING